MLFSLSWGMCVSFSKFVDSYISHAYIRFAIPTIGGAHTVIVEFPPGCCQLAIAASKFRENHNRKATPTTTTINNWNKTPVHRPKSHIHSIFEPALGLEAIIINLYNLELQSHTDTHNHVKTHGGTVLDCSGRSPAILAEFRTSQPGLSRRVVVFVHRVCVHLMWMFVCMCACLCELVRGVIEVGWGPWGEVFCFRGRERKHVYTTRTIKHNCRVGASRMVLFMSRGFSQLPTTGEASPNGAEPTCVWGAWEKLSL